MGVEKREEKKIVVAIDESEESMYALSWCINNIISLPNQESSNSTILILLYVKPPPPAYSAFDVAGYLFGNDGVATLENYSRKLVDSVMTKAQKICMESNINIKVEKKVGSGDPKSVICGTVEKLGAHMLVMGSHDYGFFKRALLGSVSQECAKQVKCPVVVVKHPKNS
ncbi:uncharacterized protein LOC130799121 [Amaranthus tricolor]|uniref:uncharacterized protein LOC130799121 n=1 Tax=Amaranthus tricolor TaxID=29722 RepID=UPI00258DD791|nr:uncharacterized protein LOC130799121 [Amaranthus tricolor]